MSRTKRNVWIADDRDFQNLREVEAIELDHNAHTVSVEGVVYHHVTEDADGRWVYVPFRA